MQLDVSVDWRVVIFATAISTAAGLLFGVAPARFASATDPNLALKGGVQGRVGRRWTLRDALIPVQIALCFVLVTACFLSARGLQRALSAPLGFTPRGVATASFDLGLAGYDKARGLEFQQRVVAEAAQIPGVSTAGLGSTLPLSLDQSHSVVYRPGAVTGDPAAANAVVYSVSRGYLKALGMALLSGRDFDIRRDRQRNVRSSGAAHGHADRRAFHLRSWRPPYRSDRCHGRRDVRDDRRNAEGGRLQSRGTVVQPGHGAGSPVIAAGSRDGVGAASAGRAA
jgi:hypothetical protein